MTVQASKGAAAIDGIVLDAPIFDPTEVKKAKAIASGLPAGPFELAITE